MVYEHGGLALNLFKLKAIKMEKDDRGGNLIFEFHNLFREVQVDKDQDLWETRSYEDSPVSQYFDDHADLVLHYEEWTNLWYQWTGYVKRGDEALWRQQNGFVDAFWDAAQEEKKSEKEE
ncbi:hypothetical protein [Epilithonimonas lactis]|uniref:Uncharacterized protein n=1 Tax=Epilithonimonas lactis TaxID=421072 RepID=A0A085B998_9FLAO|nr:hypothetical protein [Epilithonimonas lactis]KFC19043.1 hypothetical protein IO89_16125 [Epilithonimonas lactis]SEQ94373.1 hypothetical protein SAMN04488097_3467 [Epilithonimonas lactis]